MVDGGGDWGKVDSCHDMVNVPSGAFTTSNFTFGSTTCNGLGEAPTAQGCVG